MVFGVISSPWLFLVVALAFGLIGWSLFINDNDEFQGHGCATVLTGVVLLGIAAILWKLS